MKTNKTFFSSLLSICVITILAVGVLAEECSEEQTCSSWAECLLDDEKDFFGTGRFGNNLAEPGNWEIAIWERLDNGTDVVKDQAGFVWDNGTEYDFELIYNLTTGHVSFSIENAMVEFDYDSGVAFEYIIPVAKADLPGLCTCLSSMTLNGQTICDINATQEFEGIRIFLSDANQIANNGFTLSGKVKLMWDSQTQQERPGFQLLAMNTHPTLIELADFSADAGNREVVLNWATESEIDNAGFNIYRADEKGGEYRQINAALIPAEGSPAGGAGYELVDATVENRKTYFYLLEDVDLNGKATRHGPVSANPRLLLLGQ